jgi:glycosyltransferase 2 family protein
MSRSARAWARLLGSAFTIAVLVWRLGTSPFIHGVRAVDGRVLAAAVALALLTTVCCAWRWKIVADSLGVGLPLSAAVAAYYRSIFLNVTLPGGIVGDVHRGVSHGRDVSDVGRALRAVVWERAAGQVVQVTLTVVVLLALPSPVQSSMPPVAIALVVTALVVVLVARARHAGPRPGWARGRRAAAVALASTLVVCGHAATFLIAARAAGTTASPGRVLPLALLAMLVMVLPSVGGWGPREGASAWVFGLAGLGAQQGVATAVVYGVMVFAASLPGAAVLVMSWSSRARRAGGVGPPLAQAPVDA